MPWKIQPIRGQDCRCISCEYATGIVFHSTFPSLLARNSHLGSFWELLKNQLRNFSIPANHYEHFRSRPEIFQWFSNTSEDFRRFSENFKTSQKRNIWKTLLNHFRSFPKISELSRRFSEILKPFWTVSEVFQTFPKIAKGFPKFS